MMTMRKGSRWVMANDAFSLSCCQLRVSAVLSREGVVVHLVFLLPRLGDPEVDLKNLFDVESRSACCGRRVVDRKLSVDVVAD